MGRGGALASTNTGAEIQALDRLNADIEADEAERRSLLAGIPGWVVAAAPVAAFVIGVFFMRWG
ncbi:MAG: hypothetical protein ABR509_00890 [Candidatus Limnocylindria bacterium]